jgi:hypothetical protein
MKIGILTFHEVFNPGAFFQAIGTQTLLLELGHEAQVVDYTTPTHRYSTVRLMRRLSYRLPFRMPVVIASYRRDRAFSSDRAKVMQLTGNLSGHEALKQMHFNAILIGADIVWNFDLPAIARDPVYFGHSLNTKRLIGFAPSVGQCDIDGALPEYVEAGLNRFTAIAVRDPRTQSLVERVTGTKPLIICDPAFHLDYRKLLEGYNSENPVNRPYLLVYLMGQFCDDAFIQSIQQFAKERKLRIISTLYSNKWADEDRTAHGPLEWLRLMQRAAYVVTNTFHGTVFSIMLGKSFATQYTPLIQAKTEGMIKSLKLQDRIVGEPTQLAKILESEWDIATVTAQLDVWRSAAKEYLVVALSSK